MIHDADVSEGLPARQITRVVYNSEGGPGPPGSVLTAAFTLDGQEFVALNGGPAFKFTEAVSFVVNCATQEEVDDYWEKLSDGGEKVECGWLKDRFALSWQIVPTALFELLSDPDPETAQWVLKAVLLMRKPDIAALIEAHNRR